MATILDVLDNYLIGRRASAVDGLSGRDLWRLGEEVQRFAATYDPPKLEVRKFPAYLGGWPSANFFVTDQSQLVLSSLLYCGQVVAKDPISDWFAPERYQNEHVLASRRGFVDDQGQPNVLGTRRFLALVIPALQELRPLIENGTLVLVPSESFYARHSVTINELRAELLQGLTAQPSDITRRFHPADLAVDDRVRGLFVFTGGDQEDQLRRAIDSSLRYFSREWLLAQSYGAEYIAPWAYEQYLCERGLDKLLEGSEHQKVTNALLHSDLPIFKGLTPRIVADVRDDDTFADFREKLYEVYRAVPGFGPGDDYARQLAQTEETVLRPVLVKAEREANRGVLQRIGIGLTESAFAIGARLLWDQHTGQLGWNSAIRETIGVFADKVRFQGSRDPLTAWTKLYKHHRKASDELRCLVPQAGSAPATDPWSIDGEPSMNIKVSPGIALFDEIDPAVQLPSGYTSGPYRSCPCGSGLKWRFCCQGLRMYTA